MPSSRPNTIPTVIHLLRQLKPRSILDVGIGFAKWGHLFREYTDIVEAEHDPSRYQRQNWKIQIDGIEGFPDYLTDMHWFIYNKIHIGDARSLIRELPNYDLVFLGDVLEHFSKEDGRQFLRDAFAHSNKAVILTTPKFETEQGDLCGNEMERHRSLWSNRDFKEFPDSVIKTIDRATLLAVLPKPGVTGLKTSPPAQLSKSATRKLIQTRKELTELIPVQEPFILIDEEQFRPDLPHQHALPFLERDGRYWGPPADDATAIAELDRMKKQGATRLVVVWPCFWWLEHFKGFHSHLLAQFEPEAKTPHLVVFKLR